MLNGRRLAPSGVEGAPAAPDLNLIPGSLVSRYEVLLDGASSVYGSDAVAGVTNVIMRKDFDGFEFDVFLNEPDHSNGRSYNVNAVYGMNFDRQQPMNMPELGWEWGYPFALAVMGTTAVGLLFFFWWKGWLWSRD